MEGPEKTKNRTTIRPSGPTPGHISGEDYNSKRYVHPRVHCSTIYNGQDKSDRERQIPCGITHMWNLKYYTNELIYETETET